MNGSQIEVIENNISHNALKIYKLFQQSYKVEADIIGLNDFPPLSLSIQDIVQSDGIFEAISINTNIVAIVCYKNIQGTVELQNLAVSPEFFRRGLASMLLNHLFNKYQKCKFIIHTALANIPAVRLYEKLGFTLNDTFVSSEGIELAKMVKSYNMMNL